MFSYGTNNTNSVDINCRYNVQILQIFCVDIVDILCRYCRYSCRDAGDNDTARPRPELTRTRPAAAPSPTYFVLQVRKTKFFGKHPSRLCYSFLLFIQIRFLDKLAPTGLTDSKSFFPHQSSIFRNIKQMLLAVCGCSAANVARKWCYCSLTGAGALLSQGTLISCRYRLKRGAKFGIVEKMGNNRAVSEVAPRLGGEQKHRSCQEKQL